MKLCTNFSETDCTFAFSLDSTDQSFPALFDAVTLVSEVPGLRLPDGYAMESGVWVSPGHISANTTAHIQLKNVYKKDGSANLHLYLCALDLMPGVAGVAFAAFARLMGLSSPRRYSVNRSETPSSVSTSSTSTTLALTTGEQGDRLRLTGTSAGPFRKGVSYAWMVVGAVADEQVGDA